MANLFDIFTPRTSAALAANGFETTEQLARAADGRSRDIRQMIALMVPECGEEIENVLYGDDCEPLDCHR